MSGFTSDALVIYRLSTPFITMDVGDFMAVLDKHIRLDDLMTHKRKHASQTGHRYLPVSEISSRMDNLVGELGVGDCANIGFL
jgi:hypothetical protein